jgi:hypothetical protein
LESHRDGRRFAAIPTAAAEPARSRDGDRPAQVPAPYPWLLGIFTLLFVLRVLGQILVGIREVGFLPPFEQWYSGLLPYPLLLPAQIALAALMLKIVADLARGQGYFAALPARTGTILMVLGSIYFLSMPVRYAVTMARHPELRWFTGTIPIWFHMVLAAFVFTFGHYLTRRGDTAARSKAR